MNARSTFRKAAIVIAFGVAGWAYCGSLVGVGRQFLTIETALIVHAIGAPIGFAVLTWIYQHRYGFTSPLATALIFLGLVIALDVFVVAMVFERSFAMFRSLLGTWLPFLLIFLAAYLIGMRVRRSAVDYAGAESGG